MSARRAHPHPPQGNSPLAVGQADQQQLMPRPHLAAIYNQPVDMVRHVLQQLPRDRLIPLAYPNVSVVHKALQPPGGTPQDRPPRQLAGYPAQLHRFAFKDPRDQPGHVLYSRFPLSWTHLQDFVLPGMIQLADRHLVSPSRMVRQTLFYRSASCRSAPFPKLSGS